MTGGADVLWYCLGVASSPTFWTLHSIFAGTTDPCIWQVANDLTSVGVTDDGIVRPTEIEVQNPKPAFDALKRRNDSRHEAGGIAKRTGRDRCRRPKW